MDVNRMLFCAWILQVQVQVQVDRLSGLRGYVLINSHNHEMAQAVRKTSLIRTFLAALPPGASASSDTS